MDDALKKLDIKLSATDLKLILRAVSWRVETAPPVIAKVHKPGKAKADPLRGLYEAKVDGKPAIVEYEPDPDLRDTEQVPLLEPGGIEAFIRREVLPYTPDAWIKEDATKIGYEISFTRHFYKPQPLRTLDEIRADILAVEKEAEGLLDELAASNADFEGPSFTLSAPLPSGWRPQEISNFRPRILFLPLSILKGRGWTVSQWARKASTSMPTQQQPSNSRDSYLQNRGGNGYRLLTTICSPLSPFPIRPAKPDALCTIFRDPEPHRREAQRLRAAHRPLLAAEHQPPRACVGKMHASNNTRQSADFDV